MFWLLNKIHARQRRGVLLEQKSTWRRCDIGTNTITNHGAWRQGSRRVAKRPNRTGQTRWRPALKMTTQPVAPAAGSEAKL